MEQLNDPVIFINYRRTDAGWPADHLAEKLRTVFGKDRVFLDSRSIAAGEDFTEEIRSHLERAVVLIVLIGKSWLFVHDEFGRRRLDHRDDWVRREISAALARKSCKVIPVLLDDAELPNEKQALPRDISMLLKRQRIRVTQMSSEHDIERLINEIEKSGFKRRASAPSQPGTSSSPPATQAQDDGLQRKKMERAESRKEEWLQEALNHAEEVLRHINAARAAAIQEIGLIEPDRVQIAILEALTPEYSPDKLKVVEALDDDVLKGAFANVQEAFRAVRIAQMDLAHGAPAYSEEYEPTYVVQWYTTQLTNFASVARRFLSGT
jgi:hypothetical protein